MSGRFYDPEVIGAGVALLDYDNDGDLDVLLVQGDQLEPARSKNVSDDSLNGSALRTRLFRNDLVVRADGTRTLRFTDVTVESKLDARGYGMGVATGDFDNDGCVDVYLTKFGANQLLRNNCDGTFTDVTRRSGTSDEGWSVPATFFDYDRDGWLDLFVGHYLSYSIGRHSACFSVAGAPDYCSPGVRKPEANRLFHNNRDGTFTDVTSRAGLASDFGGALGAVAADFNGDGWPDLYVSNDSRPNQLWINQRDGRFMNTALAAGAAVSADGTAKASMGTDAGDFDNDGDDDLIITNLTGQGADLFVNDGSGAFTEDSVRVGLHALTLPYTGFGTAWVDIDNDGRLDAVTVNGMVLHDQEHATGFASLAQRMQLLRNVGGRFEDITVRGGPAFTTPRVGRGAAFGDLDNDGDIDVVVANDNGPARVLINEIGQRNNWIGLRLVGGTGRRDMLGARVAIVKRDGSTLWRRARSDGSYASANDPRVRAGLGQTSEKAVTVRVQWPDGTRDEWRDVPINRYTTLEEPRRQ